MGMRIFKTLGAVLLVCAAYGLLGGRTLLACIGAVFGMGSFGARACATAATAFWARCWAGWW
ncbi:MAG: hypothetical protein ACLR7U_01935 [Ruthenibacterium lactatiformans]